MRVRAHSGNPSELNKTCSAGLGRLKLNKTCSAGLSMDPLSVEHCPSLMTQVGDPPAVYTLGTEPAPVGNPSEQAPARLPCDLSLQPCSGASILFCPGDIPSPGCSGPALHCRPQGLVESLLLWAANPSLPRLQQKVAQRQWLRVSFCWTSAALQRL